MTRARKPSKVFERIAKNRWHRLFTDEEQKTDYSHGHGMLSDCHFKHLQICRCFFSSQTEFLASGMGVPENCQMLCRDCNIKKTND